MSRESRVVERWVDLRDNADQCLKLLGMLPAAIRAKDDDPEFIESVVNRLSDHLCSVDSLVGEEPPVAVAASKNDSFPEDYVVSRDSAIGTWLTEITELVSELVSEVDDNSDHLCHQVQHLHRRVWAMRQRFGFVAVEAEAQKSEATE